MAGPDEPVLARIGQSVAARLLAARAQQVPSEQVAMFAVPGFLDAADCNRLIVMIDAGRQPSLVLAEVGDLDYRTSESCNLDRWNSHVRSIDRRICDLLGIDEGQGETLQGQRYASDQRFKPHHDYFLADQAYWPEQATRGGQRSWTAMIYLNAPEAGGATNFPAAGFAVEPRAGMLIAWNNMAANGAPNPMTIHEGRPVESGVKYIVTKWFRERNWL